MGNIWILFALAVGVLVIFSFMIELEGAISAFSPRYISAHPQGILYPVIYAAGQTIENALITFNGRTGEPVPHTLRIVALASLLVVYIVCPTVFFLKWRKRRIHGKGRVDVSWLFRLDALYFVSSLGVIGICASSVIGVPAEYFHRENLYKAQALRTSHDNIMNEIITIATKIAEYRILPKEFGGGGGSLDGFILSTEWLMTDNAYYFATAHDTVVHLRAVPTVKEGRPISVSIGKDGKRISFMGM